MTGRPKRLKPSERAELEKSAQSQSARKPARKRRRSKAGQDVPPSTDANTTPPEPAPFDHLINPLQRAFLQAFCITGQILRSAEAAGCSRWAHYTWMSKDPEYRLAYRRCEKIAGDYLESQAYRLAVEGVKRIKFDRKGEPLVDPRTGEVYMEEEYSVPALLALLKAAKPKKYREQSETKHTLSFDKAPAPGDGLRDFLKQRGGVNGNGHH